MHNPDDKDSMQYLLKHAMGQETIEELAEYFSTEEIDMVVLARDRLRALDWIAKALPWLEWIKANANTDAYIDPSDLAELTALIAQAEGKQE